MSSRAKRNRRRIHASESNNTSLGFVGAFQIIAANDAQGKPAKPTFSLNAYNGGPMVVAGWRYPVVVDGQGVLAEAGALPVYLTHEKTTENLMGQTARITVDAAGKISATGAFTASRDSSRAFAQMLDHASNGYQWQCSMGAGVGRYEFCDEGKSVTVNGQTFNGPVYVARKVSLDHIAIVPLGADTTTTATIAAQSGKENLMNFEQWLIAQGKDASQLSGDEKSKLQAAYNAMQAAGILEASAKPPVKPVQEKQSDGGSDVDPIKAANAAHAANLRRIAAIDQLQASYSAVKEVLLADGKTKQSVSEFCAAAIEAGTAANEVEITLLRASRAPSQTGIPAIHDGSVNDSLSAAAVLEAGLCLHARLPKPEEHFEEPVLEAASRRYRRVGLQETIMLAANANGWQGRMTPSVYKEQHASILRAAFAINAGFSSVDISGILSNTANKFLLASFNAVEQTWRKIAKITPHGDFKTMTRYRMTSAGDYAKVGPDGELKHGSLGSESYTNTLATYGKMLTITREAQYNDDLGALTQIPSQLGGDAGRKFNSIFWTTFQDNASFFTSARGNLVDGSGRPFYLLANPAELATMDVAFLDGRDTPVVESAQADFNTLGISMRSYHDFGTSLADWYAGVRSSNVLTLSTLEAAFTAFNNLKFADAKGNKVHPTGIAPAILLVATGDFVMAGNIYKSAELRDTTASTKAPTSNAFQGMFDVVMSRYLANS
jgi:hypothetical protein